MTRCARCGDKHHCNVYRRRNIHLWAVPQPNPARVALQVSENWCFKPIMTNEAGRQTGGAGWIAKKACRGLRIKS